MTTDEEKVHQNMTLLLSNEINATKLHEMGESPLVNMRCLLMYMFEILQKYGSNLGS